MVQCERKNTHGLCCYHACASAIDSIMAPTSPGQVCIMALKVSPNRVGGRYFVISSALYVPRNVTVNKMCAYKFK